MTHTVSTTASSILSIGCPLFQYSPPVEGPACG